MVAPGQRLITKTLALAALLALAAPLHAQSDEAATRAQLEQLEKDIARIQTEIGSRQLSIVIAQPCRLPLVYAGTPVWHLRSFKRGRRLPYQFRLSQAIPKGSWPKSAI